MAKLKAVEVEPVTVTNTDDKILLTCYVDKALAAEIDDFRWANRIEGRAGAVRQLIICALHPAKDSA